MTDEISLISPTISPTINFRIKIPVKPLRPIGLPVTVSKTGTKKSQPGAARI